METIISYFNSAGNSFVDFVWPMLIQSSILIIILLGLDLILRRKVRAVVRYGIWMLVLVKLLLPPTLTSPTGLGYWIADKLPEVTSKEAIQLPGSPEVSLVDQLPAITPPEVSFSPAAPPVVYRQPPAPLPQDLPTSRSATHTTPLNWQATVFGVWSVGVITMVLLLLQRLIFVKGLISQSDDVGDPLSDALSQCSRQMAMRRMIMLKLSPNAASPSVCGLFRPVILIPRGLVDKLTAPQLRAVLLHELAHIKRGDLWVSFIQTILQILYFYNPLLWLANALIRKVREQAVDEMVLVAMGEQAEDYPNTLLNVSKLTFRRPALSLRLIGVVESKSALKTRIKHIVTRPIPKTAKLGIMGLLTIAITAAVLLPMAKGSSAKDNNDWTKPTERWKTKSIKKTSLESFFGGWKNLSFEISTDEEQSVERCTKLFTQWYNMDAVQADKSRKELEAVISERPDFFYPEFLLGIWHRDYGDKEVGRQFIKKAYEHAPVILVQKYQDENGEPIAGLEIQSYEIECNRAKKGSLNPNLKLEFRDLVTDDDGCIYVPVYDTVYRRSSASLPSGYNIAYPTLGWFKARSKAALMPIAKSNSTDGGLYETAKASKDFKVKVGPTEFEAHSVIRWQRNGNVVIKNPDGSEKRVIDMETPDYSSQAKWMDIAQVRLSPAPENYEVIELRVFDHAQRKLLSEDDYLAVGYNRRDVSVNLYSVGKLLPDKIDVWMRVLHVPDTKKVWRIKPQENATVDIGGNSLNILAVKDGGGYSYSGGSAGIKWGKHDVRSDRLATTISLKFDMATKDQYQICAVSKDHRRYVPDSPHFILGANGIQVLTFGFSKDQIAYFEVSPFISRDTFYFDGVKLPEVSDEFEPVPEVTFQIDGKEGKFTNIAFAPFELELQTFESKRVTGLAVSDENWRCSFSTADAYDRTCGFAFKAPGLSMKIPKFQYYDKQGNYITTKYTHQGSGHGKTLTMAYNSINLPIENIHSVDVYFDKSPENIPPKINTSEVTQNSELRNKNYIATLPSGVTVELIGVCEHPSEGKQWWAPDGSLLKWRPYDASPATLLNSTYKYEFVYRLSGSPGLLTTLDTNKDFGGGMGPRCLSDSSKKIYLPDKNSLYSCVRESIKALKQGDITILVGNESDWATVTAMESPSELGSVHTFDAIITRPLERDGITYVDVVAPKVTNQARVIAVDKQGHKHIGRGYSSGSTFGSTKVFATGVEFPLPLSDIQSIEYQTQDFIPVTFKNVSLQPGHKTDVQVEGAGLTKRFSEWLDWQNMAEYSGIVQNQNGECIQKVKVRAVWSYPEEPLEITEFTNNQGRFNITLPKITKKYTPPWEMFFEHPDYALGWLSPENRTRHKDPNNLEIILYQPTTVSGIVENSESEPVADAQIYADIEPTPKSKQNYPYLHLDSKNGLGVKTDNNGRFIFEKIPVWAKLTEIIVEAKEKGYVFYSAKHKDKEFSVAAGTNNLIFTLETAGALRGCLLLDAKPYPREGVRIYAWDPNLPNPKGPYSLQWTETDNTGQFEIKGVPQGNYTVTFAISPSPQLTEEKLENIRVTPTKTTYVEFDLRKTILDEKSGQESLPAETKTNVQVEAEEGWGFN